MHGILSTENEVQSTDINEVAQKWVAPKIVDDDVAIHRPPSKPNKVPGIIVRFDTQGARDTWIERRNVLRWDKIFLRKKSTCGTRWFYGCKKMRKRTTKPVSLAQEQPNIPK